MKQYLKKYFADLEIEVPIEVSFKSFLKRYYIDLLINGNALYEFKTTPAILKEHHAQTSNYLFLTGLKCARIINFRPISVERQPVITGFFFRGMVPSELDG